MIFTLNLSIISFHCSMAYILEKWFPLQSEQAQSLHFFVRGYVRFQKTKYEKEKEEETKQQQINRLTAG